MNSDLDFSNEDNKIYYSQKADISKKERIQDTIQNRVFEQAKQIIRHIQRVSCSVVY